jgi:hypothetical protein
MTKTSTIHLIVNNLASKTNVELNDLNKAFDFEAEFADVFEKLDKLSFDVQQGVVDNILAYAAQKD